MHKKGLHSQARRGSTIIEFAFIAFVLFQVSFAVFEFCRMGLVYTELAGAARVAARYAVTHGTDRTSTCNSGAGCGTADSTASSSGICGTGGVLNSVTGLVDASKLVCTFSGLGGAPGATVQVNVSYAYDPWFNMTPFHVTLTATSQGIITY